MGNSDYVSESEMIELLAKRYSPPAYAFLPQVRNGTGFLKSARTADALSMSLWPSRGLDLNGFELKSIRGDWLNELKRPEKADEIAQFCDFWWVVAPTFVIQKSEVPSSWGWMSVTRSRLKIEKDAEKLKAKPIDRPMMAAIFRRVQEIKTPDAMMTKAAQRGREEGEKQARQMLQYDLNKYQELKNKVAVFKQYSGIDFEHTWNDGETLGKAVKEVLNGDHHRLTERTFALEKIVVELLKDIRKNLGINGGENAENG